MKWFVGRFYYAYQGLKSALIDRSIRLQCFFGLIVLFFGWFFHCSKGEWMVLIWSIGLVIAAETFNSCIEGCVDYISLNKDPRAKRIKDMAAFAVSIISLCAAFCGLCIFLPKLF